MSTKNTASFFSDDFAELFDEADMDIEENSQDSVLTLIRLLEDERNIQKRLETIQNLVINFIPKTSIFNVDKKLLQHIMPAVKSLLGDVLGKICQILPPPENCNEQSVETCNILQDYLQVCLSILEAVNNMLDNILKNENINLCYIQSVPLNLIQILQLAFQHCKDSTKLYKEYQQDLKEVVLLFRAAQDIHVKFLKLLEEHVSIDKLLEEETVLIQQVLEILGEIGEILVDMNVKALADNWKGYMTLTQKFEDSLKQSAFNIYKSLMFISSEITRNLNNVLKMGATDLKTSTQTLKICGFFVRVAVKLYDTFWSNLEEIFNSAFEFVLSLYSFYPPFLKHNGYSENVVDQIFSVVLYCTDPLLEKLLHEQDFYKIFSKVQYEDSESPELLFLLTSIFEKLPTIMKTNQQIIKTCCISGILNLYFKLVKKNYSKFFWNFPLPTSNEKQALYGCSVKNIIHTILLVNQEQYIDVEIVLFKNVMQDSIWCALLASDIWCSVLRRKNSKLIYETLYSIMEKTKPLLLDNVNRPEKVFLENLLQRLYGLLSEIHKKAIIDKYPPSLLNLYVWKIFSFRDFPNTHSFMVESLLINIMEKIEGFSNGNCSIDDFNLLCIGLETMSSVPSDSSIDIKHILLMIINMWNFEVENYLKNNPFFKQLIMKLCRVTNNFITYLNNEQLLLVLTKLKRLLRTDSGIRLWAAQILNSLAAKSIPSPDQNQIIILISEIFRSLLFDKNPIVRQNTLQVFFHVLNTTPHDEIVQNTVKNEKQLQLMISKFVQKNIIEESTLNATKYFGLQEKYKFQHKCLNFSSTKLNDTNVNYETPDGIQKKPKIDNDEIYSVIKRITSDVKLLHTLCGKESASKENIAEIVTVLSQQVNYKF